MSENKDFSTLVKELKEAKKHADSAYTFYFKGKPMDYDLNECISGMKKYMDLMYEVIMSYSQEKK